MAAACLPEGASAAFPPAGGALRAWCRRATAALRALALGDVAACAYPRLTAPVEATQAFDRPGETALGRRFEPVLAPHPDASGLYVLKSGLDAFAARIGLIHRPERALHLHVYIFHDDVPGRLVLDRLPTAADRGVRVRLLVDDVGTTGLDAE